MHILFLTDNFPPEVNAPASRTFEHAREWVQHGHRVTVITCAPNFPSGRVFAGYRNKVWQRQSMDGIEVVRVWTYMTSNDGFLRRSLDYMSFMAMAIPASLFIGKVDIVVATSPQLFTACAGFIAGLLKRTPYVFELRDLWPESIRAVGAMRSSRMLDALEKLELFLYRRAAHVVCVTRPFQDNLAGRGIPRDKTSLVMNGADLSRFRPMPRDAALADELGLTGKFVVGYVGTHGMAHGLTTLLAAAERVKASPAGADVHVLLLGDGAEKAKLKSEASRRGLDNVTFIDSVPRSEVPRFWTLLDLSLIHLRRTPLFETVIPSKLFECMAMGLPVLHGVTGESADIVTREGVGVCFEPEDDAGLARLILELRADPARLAVLRSRAIEAAARYDRKAMAGAMLATLESVAMAKGRKSRGIASAAARR